VVLWSRAFLCKERQWQKALRGEKRFVTRMVRSAVLFGILVFLISTVARSQTIPTIPGLPGTLAWQNTPRSWHMDNTNLLTISAAEKSDWFVDPFDGTVANNAPILLFSPGSDYVLSARVTLKFVTKWDAGALMLWGDDHHWAKLSFELSPGNKPTLVTVVTRGLSDDCNSSEVRGDSVYLRIAKSGATYVFYDSLDGHDWQILRTFSLDTELPMRAGFEAQSPAGSGAIVKFSAIAYDPHRIGNIYK
jgi:regulation of enolase protein 1 (concanavalin A-like superfamily)